MIQAIKTENRRKKGYCKCCGLQIIANILCLQVNENATQSTDNFHNIVNTLTLLTHSKQSLSAQPTTVVRVHSPGGAADDQELLLHPAHHQNTFLGKCV